MHDGEDSLLHFASVFRSEDHHFLRLKIQADARLAADSFDRVVRREWARIENHPVGLAELSQLRLAGTDEHVLHEQSVIGPRADDADLDAVLQIPARIAVNDVNALTPGQVVDGPLAVDAVRLRRQLDIDVSPPDVASDAGLIDNSLVLGAAAGFGLGMGDDRPAGCNDPIVELDGVFVEQRARRVSQYPPGVDAVFQQIDPMGRHGWPDDCAKNRRSSAKWGDGNGQGCLHASRFGGFRPLGSKCETYPPPFSLPIRFYAALPPRLLAANCALTSTCRMNLGDE